MTKLTLEMSEGAVWFTPCRFDATFEDGRDPFTGKTIKLPKNGKLTRKEQSAVKAVLDRARMPGITNMIAVADGGMAELSVYPSSVAIEPRRARPTLGLACVLFDVLVAGNWCIQTDEALVVADGANAEQRPPKDTSVPDEFYEGFPENVVVVESAAALAAALGWSARSRQARRHAR